MLENKNLFETDTTWPFPLIRYAANTTYVEVRKASGIAYILLQLIMNAKDNSESLVGTLKSFGVPNDIHHIFAVELTNMINIGILNTKDGRKYSSELIEEFNVSDFQITDLGRKLFSEGTIPTGNNNNKILNVYFDVSKKAYLDRFNQKMYDLNTSALDNNCIGKIAPRESDVEEYIQENMSKYGFRKGERIVGFEHQDSDILIYKIDNQVKINITSENIFKFEAKEKDRNLFIHENYSADILTNIMNAKVKNYHFSENVIDCVKEYDAGQISNIFKYYTPSSLADISNQKKQISLGARIELKSGEFSLEKVDSIKIMEKAGIPGVACYFDNGNLFSILPGKFSFDVENISGKVSLNLIALLRINEPSKFAVMRELFFKSLEYEDYLIGCELIKKLTQISKSSEYMEQFANFVLAKKSKVTEKIELFLEINTSFSNDAGWRNFAKENASRLFDSLCNEVSLTEFSIQHALGKKLNNLMGLNAIDFLQKLSKNIIEKEGAVAAYELMDNGEYKTDDLLSVANVLETFLRKVLDGEKNSGSSKLALKCSQIGIKLSELKEITKISNPLEDSAAIEFDKERFLQVMASFNEDYSKVQAYKVFAANLFKTLEDFRNRFQEVKDVVVLEKEAMQNPVNINKKYIDQKVNKSMYKEAICDLHVRLQYELNRIFKTAGLPTFDLLENKALTQFISEEEIGKMHKLRICRNGFQHPESKSEVKYSAEIINEWCEIVEKIGGIDLEPRSKN